MFNEIKPKTYNDAVRLARCHELRKYVPAISEDELEKIFWFLSRDKGNSIIIADSTLSYNWPNGKTSEAVPVNTNGGISFTALKVSTTLFTAGTINANLGGDGFVASNNNNNNNG
ncbi:MAG: hypothetical protein IJ389_05360 [Clostridia bacterium]|nr:hypothetical protein [Clostridia bacterium]